MSSFDPMSEAPTVHANRTTLATLTVEALRQGIGDSRRMRAWIANRLGAPPRKHFVNTHAWALVDLQRQGRIEKVAPHLYRLAPSDSTVDPADRVAPPRPPLPQWARQLIGRANRANRLLSTAAEPGPIFTSDDLIALWERGHGRCEITGLAFNLRKVGTGKAKRVYAPSLDRIDGGGFYTRENCRLVMVGINFALNRWGLDTYLELAEAAVEMSRNHT